MNDLLLGLDIGTSSVKAAAFSLDGKMAASASIHYPCYSPHSGWYEQDPSDWLQGAFDALRQVASRVHPAPILAVGLSGQSPSHVLVNSDGSPLARSIIWRDHRALAEAEWIKDHITPQEMEHWTGLKSINEVTQPPARLLWFKNHLKEAWSHTRFIAHPKDFIGFALTGEMATDVQTAFTLFNPASNRYEPDYFDRLGIPIEYLPSVIQPAEIIGRVTEKAAAQTGLKVGIPVIAGTIDAFCDSLAGGAIHPGWAVDVAGTSEVVSLGVRKVMSGKGIYTASIGSYGNFLCGPTQAGGDTLAWLCRGFYPEIPREEQLFACLETEARDVPPGSQGVVFLPYLNGERAPIWDPMAKGCFFGLSMEHSRKNIARAVYEGVAYSIRHILETCEEVAGEKAQQITLCGGGSRSHFWNQIKADVLQRPVSLMDISETACLGAAMLAGLGIRLFTNLDEAVTIVVRPGITLEPQGETAAFYQTGYQVYRNLYPALQSLAIQDIQP